MKFLMCMCLLSTLFGLKEINKSIEYNDNFYTEIEEVDSINNKYLMINENDISFFLNNNYLFSLSRKNNDINFDYVEYNEMLYVAYVIDNTMYLSVYKDNAKTYFSKTFDVNDVGLINNSKISINVNEKGITIICSNKIDENYNILFITLDQVTNYNTFNIKTYSCSDNLYLLDSMFYNGDYYLVIEKDGISDSDFGTCSAITLAKINNNKVITYKSFKESNYKTMYINDAKLYLSFSTSSYSFDLDLNQIYGFKNSETSKLSCIGLSDIVVCIDDSSLYIYNLNNINELLLKLDLSEKINYIDKVDIYDENIYIYNLDKYYKLDLIDFRKTIKKIIYEESLSSINSSTYTLFRKLDYTYEDTYDPSVNGTYYVNYNYLDKYQNIIKTINVEVDVLPYENVIEGMTYPVNYHLNFVGTAFLNNKMIDNDYILKDEGEYKLEIFDKDKNSRIINFKVDTNQLDIKSINNYSYPFDKTVSVNDDVIVSYNVNLDEYQIEKIIVNDKEYNLYTYKDKYLNIIFNYGESGIKKEVIKKIILKKDDTTYFINLDDILHFNILDKIEKPNVNITELEKNVEILFNSETNNLVGISIYLDNDLYYSDVIKAMNLSYINSNYSNMSISLKYLIGDGTIYEEEILAIDLTNMHSSTIGHININKKEDQNLDFTITLSKEDISDINLNNQEIFKNDSTNKNNTYIYLIVLIIVIIISVLVIKLVKYYKNKE